MNDKQSFTNQIGKQGTADVSSVAQQARGHRRWVEVLKHRWPTALGVAVAALTFFDEQVTVEFVSFVSAIIVLMRVASFSASAL